jgi:hypothetical protein
MVAPTKIKLYDNRRGEHCSPVNFIIFYYFAFGVRTTVVTLFAGIETATFVLPL